MPDPNDIRPWKKLLGHLYAKAVYYPTLGWNMLNGRLFKRWQWWSEINADVILGAVPFRSDVQPLAELGVGAVVNTCQEFQGHCDLYQQYRIEQHWMPTIDFTHPSLQDVQGAVEFMDHQIQQGRKVYVHCKAGRARSATVVVCYLISKYGMSPKDAQNLLVEKRKQVLASVCRRPVVLQFAAMCQK